MTPLRFDEKVVDVALRQIGLPYLWAGNGDWAVRTDPLDGLAKNIPVRQLGCDSMAFDCVGLVKWCALQCGAKDLRGWWNADHLWHLLPDMEPMEQPGWNRLIFFGSNGRASHIEIDMGRGVSVGAAGGDSTTLTYSDAMKRGARVRVARVTRGDVLGYRSLSAVLRLPARPGPFPVTPTT